MLAVSPALSVPVGGAIALLGLGAVAVWRNRRVSWHPMIAGAVGLLGAGAMIGGAVIAFSAHGHGNATRVSPIDATRSSVRAGCELFIEHCAVCHGTQGQADGPAAGSLPYRPPKLGKHLRKHGDAVLFLSVSRGRPLGSEVKIMPPFDELLTEEDRWNVVNFLWETFGSGDFEPGEAVDCSVGPR